MPVVQNGLDAWVSQEFAPIQGKTVGVVCNQATISSAFVHIIDLMLPYHRNGKLKIGAAFGPQHGIWGHTQDNMIEWEGYTDRRTGLHFYSLYGEHRQPTPEMLAGLDALVFDVPDIGTRYYTFIWTLALCMKACEPLDIPVFVLDRPNPIGGTQVEGGVLDPAYASFVGLYPLPTRHGMTMGEIALYLNRRYFPKVPLTLVEAKGWNREAYGDECGAVWAMPSPNMPTVDTAVVYPGMCLIEGTQLSEGRGTTRPFETFGAPFIDGWELCSALNALSLPGVYFRPVQFEPTFQKHKKTVCQGGFIHVTDRRAFHSVLTGIAVIREIVRLYPKEFKWLDPPYEYEWNLMPIEILAGNGWLREAIEKHEPLDAIRERLQAEADAFAEWRQLLYKA